MKKSRLGARERRLLATAHHEAGHAVMAEMLGVPYLSVTIIPTSEAAGQLDMGAHKWPTSRNPLDFRARAQIEKSLMVLMAGFISEKSFTGRANNVGAAMDQAATWEMTESIALTEAEQCHHLDALFHRATAMMSWPEIARSVRAVAHALFARGTLKRREVVAIVGYEFDEELRRRRARARQARAQMKEREAAKAGTTRTRAARKTGRAA